MEYRSLRFQKRRSPLPISVVYGNALISNAPFANHLGILQHSNMTLGERISGRIQRDRNSLFQSFHGAFTPYA